MTRILSALRSIAMAVAVLGLAMVGQFGAGCEGVAVAAPAAVTQTCADMMLHKSQDRKHAGDCAAICVAIPAPALAAREPFEIAPIASLAGRLPVLSGMAAPPETPPPRMG
jgi:hypothetical protein